MVNAWVGSHSGHILATRRGGRIVASDPYRTPSPCPCRGEDWFCLHCYPNRFPTFNFSVPPIDFEGWVRRHYPKAPR